MSARRGSARINTAAMAPATATIASPARIPQPTPGMNRRGQCQRRQGDTVDQPEHQEREAEHAYARRAPGIAAHDRDAHRVVEPAGKDDADQGRAAVARGEGERARTLAPPEQPPPAERLESLGEKQQQCRGDEQAGVSARERPAGGSEMADGEQRERDRDQAVAQTEAPTAPPRTAKAHERPEQHAIPTLERDRRRHLRQRNQRLRERDRLLRHGIGVRAEAACHARACPLLPAAGHLAAPA